MIFGGIPYYLDYFEPGLSLAQNVDNLFFRKNAVLKDEFDIPVDRFIIYGILMWNELFPTKKICLPMLPSTAITAKTHECPWKKWVDKNYITCIKRWYDWDKTDYQDFVDDFHTYIKNPFEFETITWTIIHSLF